MATDFRSRPPKPGPSLRLALALLIAGVAIGIPAAVVVVVRAVRVINSPSIATPATIHRHLSAGTWIIFERTGTRSGAGGFTFGNNGPTTLDPTQVKVTSADGTPAAVDFASGTDTITKGSAIYTASVQFHVPSSGTYTIAVDAPAQVLLTRSFGDTFGSLWVALLFGGAGGVLFLTGVVLLIVGSIRRSRGSPVAAAQAPGGWGPGGWPSPGPAAPPPPPVPPGWYPDPQAPGSHRWWDGRGWTGHHN